MELSTETAFGYLRLGFDQLVAVADRLGDDRVSRRPLGPSTNSVAAISVHLCGVTEFWLGHVGLGRPSSRDRDAELEATATVAELRERIGRTLDQAHEDLAALSSGSAGPSPHAGRRQYLVDESDAALVLHVIEELFQHLGHAELTVDALR